MPLTFQPWRAALAPASFGGAEFHVEADTQISGRRVAVHEFPKQDTPWAEDMGRRARRWTIDAYLISPTYIDRRDALIQALETEDAQTLVHPLLGEVQAICENYSVTETREDGGFCRFTMAFVEAGQEPSSQPVDDTQNQVSSAADTAGAASAAKLNFNSTGPNPTATSAPISAVSAGLNFGPNGPNLGTGANLTGGVGLP